MRLTLVLTREVQIDIRLLVALESKEGLERNVKSRFRQLFSTDRTDAVGHITPRHTCILLYFR